MNNATNNSPKFLVELQAWAGRGSLGWTGFQRAAGRKVAGDLARSLAARYVAHFANDERLTSMFLRITTLDADNTVTSLSYTPSHGWVALRGPGVAGLATAEVAR